MRQDKLMCWVMFRTSLLNFRRVGFKEEIWVCKRLVLSKFFFWLQDEYDFGCFQMLGMLLVVRESEILFYFMFNTLTLSKISGVGICLRSWGVF